MTGERLERRLAAILAADVVGYSRLVSADEADALTRLGTLRRDVIEPNIANHSGRLFKIMGDGFLAEFASAVQAVSCALAIQATTEAAASGFDDAQKMRLRIGIHVGDVMVEGEDLMGDGINIAARLESIATAGGISISRAVHDQVRDRIKITFDDKGDVALKNIARPVQVFAVAGATTAVPVKATPSALSLPDKPSIAVLPFQNMSGDPEQEYFADGMVEEIITALSRNKQLFVIARNSSFTFKGRAFDIKQVARDLGVRYVLEGSVRKAGNRIRITGQLIDAASGAHLWADRYDGTLEDVFELQDQVAASVVGAIAPSVTQSEMERAKRKPTTSLDAYDYYLRALAAHWQFTKEATDQAIGLYEQAIALDPQYAPAYAGLAAVTAQRKTWGWSSDPAGDASQAVAYARGALRLGRQDAMVLARSASALWSCSDEIELADSLLEEAIRLDPNGVFGWIWGGWTKIVLGDHRTAIDYLQRVLRISPLDPNIFHAQAGLGFAYFFLGNYEQGLNFAADALRHHPNNMGSMRAAMACHAMSGNIEAAQKIWRQIAQFSPTDRVSETRKRMAYRRDEDLAKLQEAYRLAGMPE